MRQISAHRFLRSPQIAALVGGSGRHVLRRLQLLYHHGYLERPPAQIDSYHRAGSQPMVYGLASRGAAHLRRTLDMPLDRIDWTRKNSDVSRLFLDHALMTSEIMVGFELAARRATDVSLVSKGSLQEAVSAEEVHRDVFGWRIGVPGEAKKAGVIPDQVFALDLNTCDGRGPERTFFFLETDRGTMPVTRKNGDQTSLLRKLHNYSATWERNLHREHLGIRRFRVLIVTTGTERVGNLVDACARIPKGKGLFLFTDIGSFHGHGDPFALPWVNALGQAERLLSI